MKYKIGTKVLILGLSSKHRSKYGCPPRIEQIGLIVGYADKNSGHYPYKIQFEAMFSGETKKVANNYLECELEPIIKVGEQLVFDFMKE